MGRHVPTSSANRVPPPPEQNKKKGLFRRKSYRRARSEDPKAFEFAHFVSNNARAVRISGTSSVRKKEQERRERKRNREIERERERQEEPQKSRVVGERL